MEETKKVAVDNAVPKAEKVIIEKEPKKKGLPDWLLKKPEHQRNLYLIFSNNAEVRRFVANAIINYFISVGKINKDAKQKFIDFRVDKISVTVDGLKTEYRYSESWFANCFSAGFTCFAAHSQSMLNDYLVRETGNTFNKTIDENEINKIAESLS